MAPGPVAGHASIDREGCMQPHSAQRVLGIHHLELYVEDAMAAAQFYVRFLGFDVLGRVLSSEADRSTVAICRGNVRLLLTSPSGAAGEVAAHLQEHGEGIRDIALSVRDVEDLFARACAAGAAPLLPPTAMTSPAAGRTARIGGCGDVVHSLVDRPPDDERWVPSLAPMARSGQANGGVCAIDHVALALDAGALDRWVDFYVDGLGFCETHREDVSTEYTAMRSKVVQTPDGSVRFPMMEPATGRRASQIEDYVRDHHGAGAQHLALRSHDIVQSAAMLSGGLDLLPTPPAYYDDLETRVGGLGAELDQLRQYGILADRDADGVLLQVFTKRIGHRSALFLELVERRGARGFGSGNVKALFEAVERTQSVRHAE
jgi:4-hydroxyphenylpyruvate dioxygenase